MTQFDAVHAPDAKKPAYPAAEPADMPTSAISRWWVWVLVVAIVAAAWW